MSGQSLNKTAASHTAYEGVDWPSTQDGCCMANNISKNSKDSFKPLKTSERLLWPFRVTYSIVILPVETPGLMHEPVSAVQWSSIGIKRRKSSSITTHYVTADVAAKVRQKLSLFTLVYVPRNRCWHLVPIWTRRHSAKTYRLCFGKTTSSLFPAWTWKTEISPR